MAYRFPAEDVLTSNRRVDEALAAAPSDDFGARESMAVWLGMRDDATTLRLDNPLFARIRDWLGFGPKRPLADGRLEALRRLTVALRFDLISGAWEEASARRAGVTHSQIRALKARIVDAATAEA